MTKSLQERIDILKDRQIHSRLGDCYDLEEYISTIQELTSKLKKAETALFHCEQVLTEHIKKPGEDLKGYILGAREEAQETLKEISLE